MNQQIVFKFYHEQIGGVLPLNKMCYNIEIFFFVIIIIILQNWLIDSTNYSVTL